MLALVSGAMFITTLNFSIIVVAFPELEETFADVEREQLSWALTAYAIALAAMIVPSGWLADRFGRKRMFLAGVAVFTAGAALVAVSPNVVLLVVARAVQGAGSAMLGPAAVALVLAAVPFNRRSTAVGAFSAVAGLAAALGPVIGGALIEVTTWRWTFTLNVPIGIITLLAGLLLLTESEPRRGAGRPDLLGAGVLMFGVTAFAFGIVQSEPWGWADLRVIGSLVAAAALVAWFVERCRVHASPIVPLELFSNRNYTLANAIASVNSGSFSALYLGLVLFLTEVWEFDPLDAGLALALIPAIAAPLSLLSGRLADRFGHRALLVPGALLWACSMVWVLLALGRSTQLVTVWVPAIGLYSVGVGLSFAAVEGAAVHGLPDRHLATGSAVHRIFNEIGSTLAIAVGIVLVSSTDPEISLGGFRSLFVMMAVAGVVVAFLALGIDTRPRHTTDVRQSATGRSPEGKVDVSPAG